LEVDAMVLALPDDVVRASGLSEADLRVELAVALFKDERLTFGQAARLAGIPQADFLDVLGSRAIPLHYDEKDFEEDLATIRSLPSR
jgi:predicted HTH domain antitoxin